MLTLLDYISIPGANEYREACDLEIAAKDAAEVAIDASTKRRHESELFLLEEIRRRLDDNPVPAEVVLLQQKRRQVRQFIELRGEWVRLETLRQDGLL